MKKWERDRERVLLIYPDAEIEVNPRWGIRMFLFILIMKDNF
jgi:hypothetical protein